MLRIIRLCWSVFQERFQVVVGHDPTLQEPGQEAEHEQEQAQKDKNKKHVQVY